MKARQIINSVSARKEFANRRIFIEYLRDRPWMFGGFVNGTSPEDDYKFDRANWELSYAAPIVLVDPGKQTRASLKHSGADVAKPIYLLRDDRGEYRIRDYSNVYSSCRLPGKKVLDASLPESQDPQWVMRRFFEGIITYIDGDPAKGEEIINSVSLRKDFRNYRVFVDYLKTRPWMFGGFMKGTSPDDGYEFDHANWELNYAAAIVPVEPGKETRASFKHSGADVPKPIYLVQGRARRVPHPRLRQRLLQRAPPGRAGEADRQRRREHRPGVGGPPVRPGRPHGQARQQGRGARADVQRRRRPRRSAPRAGQRTRPGQGPHLALLRQGHLARHGLHRWPTSTPSRSRPTTSPARPRRRTARRYASSCAAAALTAPARSEWSPTPAASGASASTAACAQACAHPSSYCGPDMPTPSDGAPQWGAVAVLCAELSATAAQRASR